MTTVISPQYCGYISLIGRPNVGKSTLLNHLLEQKISITSRKPQTTRHQIIGIKNTAEAQMIFVDTPGQHSQEKRAINKYMNRVAVQSLTGIDVIIAIVDRLQWTDEDQLVWQRLHQHQQRTHNKIPIIVAINKIDRLNNKGLLLPHIKYLSQLIDCEVIPISALQGDNLDHLQQCIIRHLPKSEIIYPTEQITDRSQRFLVAEIIREKITRQLGEEMPYASTVSIENFKQQGKIINIDALILVERKGQKAIIIGDKGYRLKSIGIEARKDIELLVDSKVMLKLWVKVKNNWSDDARTLSSLGYD